MQRWVMELAESLTSTANAHMHKIQTHYDILKVTRDAPLEVVRGAYKGLSQKYHPDKYAGPDATDMIVKINASYRILSNPLTRIDHDKWIAHQEENAIEERTSNRVSPQTGAVGAESVTVGAADLDKPSRIKRLVAASTGIALLAWAGIEMATPEKFKEYYPATMEDAVVSTVSLTAVQPAKGHGEQSNGSTSLKN